MWVLYLLKHLRKQKCWFSPKFGEGGTTKISLFLSERGGGGGYNKNFSVPLSDKTFSRHFPIHMKYYFPFQIAFALIGVQISVFLGCEKLTSLNMAQGFPMSMLNERSEMRISDKQARTKFRWQTAPMNSTKINVKALEVTATTWCRLNFALE